MRRSFTAILALVIPALAAGIACSGSADSSPTPDVDASEDASVTDAIATGDGETDANGSAPSDTGTSDDAPLDLDVLTDASDENACEWGGAPGECITTSACSAEADHTSYAGQCPGPADIQCCIVTPNPADNPPTPASWVLMKQADVTSEMTTWAVTILNDPATYPMFSTTTKAFSGLLVLGRVEWHPPDFQNAAVHRGVTLYEPAD